MTEKKTPLTYEQLKRTLTKRAIKKDYKPIMFIDYPGDKNENENHL